MTRFTIIIAVLLFILTSGLLFTSCSSTDTGSDGGSGKATFGENTILRPVVYGNLAVYPVIGSSTGQDMVLITFAEAQEQEKVLVTESGGGNVPVLEIHNKSDKQLFILAGDVVYGGKQDRVMQRDVLIAPGEKANVDVRCVEAGRWHGGSGKFAYSGNVADACVRRHAQFGNQNEVWAEVRGKLNTLDEAGNTNSSAYKAVLSSEKVQASVKKYVDGIAAGLKEHDNVVGVVVAINGEVLFCDVFCNRALFDKYSRKIIESAAIQALADKTEESAPSPSAEDARDFLANAYSGKVQTTEQEDGSNLRKITNNEQSSLEIRAKMTGSTRTNSIHMNSFRNLENNSDRNPEPGRDIPQGNRQFNEPESQPQGPDILPEEGE